MNYSASQKLIEMEYAQMTEIVTEASIAKGQCVIQSLVQLT